MYGDFNAQPRIEIEYTYDAARRKLFAPKNIFLIVNPRKEIGGALPTFPIRKAVSMNVVWVACTAVMSYSIRQNEAERTCESLFVVKLAK